MKRGSSHRPSPSSSTYRIFGTRNVLDDVQFNPPDSQQADRSETSQALSVPKRKASQDEARRERMHRAIDASVARKAPLRNIKGDMPLYEEGE